MGNRTWKKVNRMGQASKKIEHLPRTLVGN